MRKIFTFLSVVFIAIAVYIAYGTFQSAQQFERDSIQRANQANALSQQIADAQALQQETSSEEDAIPLRLPPQSQREFTTTHNGSRQ